MQYVPITAGTYLSARLQSENDARCSKQAFIFCAAHKPGTAKPHRRQDNTCMPTCTITPLHAMFLESMSSMMVHC